MARRLIRLLLTVTLFFCSSCSIKSGVSHTPVSLKKKIAAISKELLRLGEVNKEWLTSQDGWIHIVSRPSVDGIMKFTYQERWTHYKLHHTECIEEMHIIRRTENSEDSQFRLHTSEGFNAELIRLRNQIYFRNTSFDKQIAQAKCFVTDRSAPLIVLTAIEENQDFIVSAEMTELPISTSTLVFIVHYRGSDSNKLGIPDNAIGKKETFYFNKETGNQLKMELELEFPEGVWKGKTSIENDIWFYFSLPLEAELIMESALKELKYYQE